MPIYSYCCPECGLEIEKFFKTIGEGCDYIPICSCETEMKKVISKSSFKLKGDGWYSKRAPMTHTELNEE